ncbi:MAG: S1C family serine protease, partial [Gammaproteobacteria bacterium]
TAFRVSEAGHLITNRHVVQGCQAVGIVAPDGVATTIRLLATDPRQDLALLEGPPAQSSATLRSANVPLQGEDALTYGFPLPGVLSAGGQLGAGMITAVTGLRNDAGQLQTDVALQSGNSGGALLDRRGQVIGVVFAKLNAFRIAQLTGDLPQNVNFAVQLAPLKRLLDAHDVRYTAGPADAPALTNQEIAAEARSWTVPIACKRQGTPPVSGTAASPAPGR